MGLPGFLNQAFGQATQAVTRAVVAKVSSDVVQLQQAFSSTQSALSAVQASLAMNAEELLNVQDVVPVSLETARLMADFGGPLAQLHAEAHSNITLLPKILAWKDSGEMTQPPAQSPPLDPNPSPPVNAATQPLRALVTQADGRPPAGSSPLGRLTAAVQATEGPLDPAQLYGLALQATGNDSTMAMMACHELTKALAGAERVDPDTGIGGPRNELERELLPKMANIRAASDPITTDRMGPYYHVFAMGLVSEVCPVGIPQLAAFMENSDGTAGQDHAKEGANWMAAHVFGSMRRPDVQLAYRQASGKTVRDVAELGAALWQSLVQGR